MRQGGIFHGDDCVGAAADRLRGERAGVRVENDADELFTHLVGEQAPCPSSSSPTLRSCPSSVSRKTQTCLLSDMIPASFQRDVRRVELRQQGHHGGLRLRAVDAHGLLGAHGHECS